MPNLVHCRATLTGPAAALTTIKESGLDFRKLYPCPFDATMHKDDRWYSWRMAHWGCKWTAHSAVFTDTPNGLAVTFETPWLPPYGILTYLTQIHVGLRIVLDFTEEFDETVGHVAFEGGRMKGEYCHPTLCKPVALRRVAAQGLLPWLDVTDILANTILQGGDIEALDALPELADRVTVIDLDMSHAEFIEMMGGSDPV
jgi:hypothetical protein